MSSQNLPRSYSKIKCSAQNILINGLRKEKNDNENFYITTWLLPPNLDAASGAYLQIADCGGQVQIGTFLVS